MSLRTRYRSLLLDLEILNRQGIQQTSSGLIPISRLLDSIGIDRAVPGIGHVVHVGGTNGKGTVTNGIASALRKSGASVGVYTSPHISSWRERIAVNGSPISVDTALQFAPVVLKNAQSCNASYFDVLTALSFLVFSHCKVDYSIIEVGMGGRLDSTNILETASLSILTSVALDHVNILGSTVDEIATEKAGILKPGVPCIIGPSVPFSVVKQHSLLTGSPLIRVDSSHSTADSSNLAIVHQALRSLTELTGTAVESPFILPSSPCRFEQVKLPLGGRVILDVAHNRQALQALVQRLDQLETKVTLVLGFANTKDIRGCLEELKVLKSLKRVVLVHSCHPRMVRFTADHNLPDFGTVPIEFAGNVENVKSIFENSREMDTIVSTGSFLIMHPVRKMLERMGCLPTELFTLDDFDESARLNEL